MPFIELRGIRLDYEIDGNGPRLLFFNGSGGEVRWDTAALAETDQLDMPAEAAKLQRLRERLVHTCK